MSSHCDYDNADLLIFWGKQPAFSMAPSLRKIYDAHDRGAKLVCIDPLRFHLAATADEVLQPEPGTDLAIMLAMIYVIIEEGLRDAEFVDSYTNDPGLKRLAAHVRGGNRQGLTYTPEWAEGISGVRAEDIRSLAIEYATAKRAALADVGFICVIDPYVSETTELADLVLPAATYLECTEPEWFESDVWLPIATLRQKSVSVGEALPDSQPAQDGFCA